MVQFHTDSIAYEQPIAVAEQVQFLRRRYSPDEKRICRITDILRPWIFQGLLSSKEKEKIVIENEILANQQQKEKRKLFTTGNIAVMAILTATAYLLYMFLKFPLPFFPSWLDIQISDLPALLGGFAINPLAGGIIVVVKCLFKMPFTSTSCVGEFADILVGIAFVLPATLIYHLSKGSKSAIIGMVVGTCCATAVSVLSNWLVLIPFYAYQFGNGNSAEGMQIIVNAVSVLYNGVTVDNFYAFYLPIAVLPFNVLRCVLCSVLTYLTYKPLSKALHWEIKNQD